MKAEELMIGDWVMEDNHKLQVVKLSKNGEYPNCNPIPLTPEILEKNGFVYNDVPFMCAWEKEGIYINDNDGVHRTLGIGVNVSASMQYVHQLQHALRLCGLTELANNLKIE